MYYLIELFIVKDAVKAAKDVERNTVITKLILQTIKSV